MLSLDAERRVGQELGAGHNEDEVDGYLVKS